ncbi:MAG: hypothetical protein KAS32_25285 [Candidatus Peribacteraceae bacterium]|nr:hypothetical protein [Candidatus Peribacteraceae bacterium]
MAENIIKDGKKVPTIRLLNDKPPSLDRWMDCVGIGCSQCYCHKRYHSIRCPFTIESLRDYPAIAAEALQDIFRINIRGGSNANF